MPKAYYNENSPGAAATLRELIKRGVIAPGDVDERSIEDVLPDELVGYTQCHFFAGQGIWSYALRLAGWSDDRPIWTGSCPCQPFSAAGQRKGATDERHLWPAWYWLIQQHKPSVIVGEQVSSKDGIAWFDTVQTDLEAEAYAVGGVDIPACSVGAPHRRQWLYFMANAQLSERRSLDSTRRSIQRKDSLSQREESPGRPAGGSSDGPVNGFWRDAKWIPFKDNRYRATEPGSFPLAYGAPSHILRLRNHGNGIVAPLAESFIRACIETLEQI